jgi:pimeloyl-ACP methyl ester carboxylesterase
VLALSNGGSSMKLEVIERSPESRAHPTPLLFVHGMFVGAWCWDEYFLPFFAENGYHTVAFSLRGHAGSDGHAGIRWYSIADYVKDVEQVAGQLEAPPVLIGISMGGFIVQKYLETHPAPAAVLMASAPPNTVWPMAGRILLHNPWPLLSAILTFRTFHVVNTPQRVRQLLFSRELSEQQLLEIHAKLQDESFRAFLDLLGLTLVHPKRIKTPILVLGAEKDWALGPDAKGTARTYGGKVEMIPSVGHYMILEPDWKSAATPILSWFSEIGI